MADEALRQAVEVATGARVQAMTVVRGGDVARAFRADLEGGERVFVKMHPSPPVGFFTTEALGLEWMRTAQSVGVPTVLVASDGEDDTPAHLILEWIEEGRPVAATEAALGRDLAALHDAGAPCFGRDDRRTTGSRGLPNDPQPTWAEFYATCRLLPLARLARDADALPPAALAGLERLASKLEQFADDEPPARLHGDLWAGNRLIDASGASWLIDPAAHGGHREFDLAMMRLFGGFSDACFRSYMEVHPLRAGWDDRVQLHQVAPLVVHAIKFGGGYVSAASAAIARY